MVRGHYCYSGPSPTQPALIGRVTSGGRACPQPRGRIIDVSDIVTRAVELLRWLGVNLARGLSAEEFARIEETFGFSFGSEHRAFLAAGLPVEEDWVDWRQATRENLQARLDRPVDGVIFDVHNNDFWPASWGERPSDRTAAEQHARERLAQVPQLVPIFAHRYLPAAPAPVPSPVFSVHQTDVIYYGDNLLDYIAHEFQLVERPPAEPGGVQRVAFWSDLAYGAENADL